PIITGKITENSVRGVHRSLTYGDSDEFLKNNLIGVHATEEEKYQLRMSRDNSVVALGEVGDLRRKFRNIRASYVKADKDNTLGDYKRVSLEFNNQVVCTKI